MTPDNGNGNLSKTKFSILKRKFNGDLKARIFAIQKKEIADKIIL